MRYALGPLFCNGEILFSMRQEMAGEARNAATEGAEVEVAFGCSAACNIMHNGFWSIDIYGIGLPQRYRRTIESGVRYSKVCRGES